MSQELEKMTVTQLRELARQLGMSSATRLTKKAELIRAIRKYRGM